MKVAYFDCFSGASGDMLIGALLDAGLDLEQLRTEVGRLQLDHYHLDVTPVLKGSIGGSQALISVEEDHHGHHHRRLKDLTQIVEASDLSDGVKEKSLTVFNCLARAEAHVHRKSISEVHFHEVGAMDTIIDVVGTVAGLELLGVDQVYCSPMNLGAGQVKCAHGILPVPAPATTEIVRGNPVYSRGQDGELLTPTGAALLTTLARGFGDMPAMVLEQVGYGAGQRETASPNLLRVCLGQTAESRKSHPVIPSHHHHHHPDDAAAA